MKKVIIFVGMVALLLCPRALRAAEVVQVADNAGNTVSFLLDDHPAVTFDDENVIITTDDTKVYYPLSAYRKFSMETATGISAAAAQQPVFSLDGGMAAEGLQPGTPVTIYSASGQALARGVADSQGKVSLAVSAPRGTVCIVKTATASFKFVK